MALTRKLLKGMGLTEEQIDSIIDAHTDSLSGLQEKVKALESDAEGMAAVKKELEGYKNGKDWKSEHDKVKQDFDAFKAEVENREKEGRVKRAYRELLKGEKIDPDLIDTVMEATSFEGMKLDKEGKLADAEKLSEGIRSKWSKFVVTTETRGAGVSTPPDGSRAKLTKADIYATDARGNYKLSSAERQKALAENPELMK